MAILSFSKGSLDQVAENFQAWEFDCSCTFEDCKETRIDEDLIRRLQLMRNRAGVPLDITSGYRCERYHAYLGELGYETAKKSTHLEAMAADVTAKGLTGMELEKHARDSGFTSVGVGQTFIHADTRFGYRRWIYRKR